MPGRVINDLDVNAYSAKVARLELALTLVVTRVFINNDRNNQAEYDDQTA